jgi:hypothetical protein
VRAYEFLNESTGKPHDHHSTVQKGFAKVRDPGGYNPTYHLNRLMMATAMSDGKDPSSIKMDHESWIGPFNSVHPYTEEEHNMIQHATKIVPSEYSQVNKWSKSQEPNDIHRTSPVNGFRGFA